MTYQSGSTTEKLQLLLNTKEAIAKAIEDRGIRLTNRNKFSTYPSEIRKIQINGWYTNYTHNILPSLTTSSGSTTLSIPSFTTSETTEVSEEMMNNIKITLLTIPNLSTSESYSIEESEETV